jgi:hypothetical protein
LVPRARDVEHVAGVAVPDGRVLLPHLVQCAVDLEQDHAGVRRADHCGMLDDPFAQGRFDRREVLALPVVPATLGLRGIEERLHLRVRPAHEDVSDRVAERLDRSDDLLALLG